VQTQDFAMKHETFDSKSKEPVTLAEPASSIRTGFAWPLAQRVIAIGAMLLLLPLFCVLYPAVRLTSRGPFFYSQLRPGQDGKPFRAYKVRTMYMGADRDAKAARSVRSGDPMVTPVGRILRDLKIDELPQLYNVVRGEMALVGPRPIAASLQQELEEKIPGFAARLQVKPGVTSLPQVCVLESGDQSQVVADWARRFEMERHYIARRSVGYDLLIIGLTLAFVVRKAIKSATGLPASLARRAGIVPVLLAAALVSACSTTQGSSTHAAAVSIPPGREIASEAAQDVAVSPLKATPVAVEKAEQDYRIGSGDVLKVNVFGETGMNDLSIRVDGDGRIQLPAVTPQKVAGLTLSGVQKTLTDAYKAEFNEPWVMVTMETYGSRPIYLLGEFNSPGVKYLDRPTNLLNALAMGNGTGANAYLPGARVIRGKTILPVDIKAVLKDGRLEQNIWLKGGDTIFVPSGGDLKFYVAGAVKTPGVYPFGDGRQTLVRAIAAAGGVLAAKAQQDKIRIIRTISPVEGQLLEVDMKKVLNGKMPDVEIKPDDIIFVAQTGLSTWNDQVVQLLPTIQLIGAPLQPFMTISTLVQGPQEQAQ
jgi:polysaccharide export outer membrane protein